VCEYFETRVSMYMATILGNTWNKVTLFTRLFLTHSLPLGDIIPRVSFDDTVGNPHTKPLYCQTLFEWPPSLVDKKTATYEKKVELFFYCLAKNMPPELVIQNIAASEILLKIV